jgi:hypothetical protein
MHTVLERQDIPYCTIPPMGQMRIPNPMARHTLLTVFVPVRLGSINMRIPGFNSHFDCFFTFLPSRLVYTESELRDRMPRRQGDPRIESELGRVRHGGD